MKDEYYHYRIHPSSFILSGSGSTVPLCVLYRERFRHRAGTASGILSFLMDKAL
jgi:hypothetical protein